MKTPILLAFLLAGCAASKQEVAARLGAQYIGQNVDALVVRFGPPASGFKMTSGGTSYVWQLTAETNYAGGDGYGTAKTRFCKVNVITSPANIVTDLTTEDSNAGTGLYGAVGMFGSICAQRLGMRPS